MSAHFVHETGAREMIFQNIDAPCTLIVAEAAQENQVPTLRFCILCLPCAP
jgi:hypothetical protein